MTQPETRTYIEYYQLNCNSEPLQVESATTGNTLSDVSSCTSESSIESLLGSATESTKSAPTNRPVENPKSPSLSNTPSTTQSSKVREETRSEKSSSHRLFGTRAMLQDHGVRPWKSRSVEQFASAPKLIEEKLKKKVIILSNGPPTEHQHLYENIDDCYRQGVDHPRKILPIPEKRLPFRQPARVPVLSIPKMRQTQVPVESESSPTEDDEVGPEISFVSYRFYDKNMREQNSLSQRCSSQLLRKAAIRLSLPRSRSTGVSTHNSLKLLSSLSSPLSSKHSNYIDSDV